MKPGAYFHSDNNSCVFNIWAPLFDNVHLKIVCPEEKIIPLTKGDRGYWQVKVDNLSPTARYLYRLNDADDRPDPASFYQPEGVHKASQVVDHGQFIWHDADFRPLPMAKMIFYETHIGTFTKDGTFAAAVKRLDHLQKLGVNTLEIMPVAQFPGSRNWGYDGVYLYAVQNSYGGPAELKYLVDECHKRNIAICLDVVYNHLGPEGNYLSMFAPYFTDKYRTPWGSAINYDDAYCCGVRDFVIFNALYWFEYFHIDALRLDAIHGIYDLGAKHILKEMSEVVDEYCQKTGRNHYLIAESDLNDTRIIKPYPEGGYGLTGQWSDDFHHAVHTLLTGEHKGYYQDFGKPDQLVKALNDGFVYSWEYSEYRKRRHGCSTSDNPNDKLVICVQNHDQVGNRMMGDRLSTLLDFEALKLAAAINLTAPYVPLLFMGEEYAEDNPFLYFVSHCEIDLIEAVRQGRKDEFKAFGWKLEPPDPQSEETFLKSKPDYTKCETSHHRAMFKFYRELLSLRKENKCLANLNKADCHAAKVNDLKVIKMTRKCNNEQVLILYNYSSEKIDYCCTERIDNGQKLLDSADELYSGEGSDLPEKLVSDDELLLNPYQFVIYQTR